MPSIDPPTAALHVNLAATWFMAGLIWLVQVVHYPQFDAVGPEHWPAYHERHVRHITFVVGPAMLLELATALLLLWLRPPGVPAWLLWAGAGMAALLWLSTALVQVPDHDRLGRAFEAATHRRLVATNWVRTALWTGRGVLMSAAAVLAARGG